MLPLATFRISPQGELSVRNVSYTYSIFRKIRTYADVFYFSVRVTSSRDTVTTALSRIDDPGIEAPYNTAHS